MKKLFVLLIFFTATFCFATEEMIFKLGILCSDNEMISFKQDQLIEPGKQYKFVFEAIEQSYIYLFAFSDNSELALLYPSRATDFDDPDYWERLTFVPAPGKWFTIPSDGPGSMEVFMVATPQRLKKLEAFLKPDLSSQELSDLYTELLILGKKYTVPPVVHEKPVPLYGVIKAQEDPEKENIRIQEIRCSGLYMEWFKLEY